MHKLFIFSIISGETIFCSSHQSAFDKKWKELKYITGRVTKESNEIQSAIKNLKICVVPLRFTVHLKPCIIVSTILNQESSSIYFFFVAC